VFYAISAVAPFAAEPRLAALLLGRVLLGVGESLFITGTMSWGIARAGAPRTGLVMSWQGIAMFAAIGIGAPLGLAIQDRFGFTGVAVLTIVTPLIACVIALALPPVPAGGGERVPFYRVIGLIWRPGVVLTLAAVPFAAMATFLALYYAARAWSGAGLALGAFGIGYVAVRLVGSHWPGRFGGARVAAISLIVQAMGQVLLWLAPTPGLAFAGAGLTGIGFSLVFPAMGVEATKRVPPALRGRAVGNFLAFFDMAIGLTGPVLGVVAGDFGFGAVFLAGLVATVASLGLLQGVRRMGVAA
jgi:predicted MFS family arabinose efflux permease